MLDHLACKQTSLPKITSQILNMISCRQALRLNSCFKQLLRAQKSLQQLTSISSS
uniref:Uncharacterized protein n=1 Tax=Rhizophora mucronata TaxID=61149 RepID=A0A2P2N0R3_RHIMU